ncbi:CBP20 [Acrasis kona]|uniref:CBP20 n=1 Tax=Acrasis kona TaxID=1008807 RepID=A0AAW2YJR4_9EUKA
MARKKSAAKENTPAPAAKKANEPNKNADKKVKPAKQDKKRKIEEVAPEEETTEQSQEEANEEETPKPVENGKKKKVEKKAEETTAPEVSEKKEDDIIVVADFVKGTEKELTDALKKQHDVQVISIEKVSVGKYHLTLVSTKKSKKLVNSHVVRIGGSDIILSKQNTYKSGLVVTNISITVTEDILNACFKEIGSIKKMTLKTSGATKVAYVTFTKELKDDALEYNGALIEDRNIKVRFMSDEDKRVVFSSVSKDVTVETLTPYLKEIGTVDFVGLVDVDRTSNTFVVQFSEYHDVMEATEYNGADIHGRACVVTMNGEPIKKVASTKAPENKDTDKNDGKNKKHKK